MELKERNHDEVLVHVLAQLSENRLGQEGQKIVPSVAHHVVRVLRIMGADVYRTHHNDQGQSRVEYQKCPFSRQLKKARYFMSHRWKEDYTFLIVHHT